VLDTDADGRYWGVTISKSWRLNDLWICHCFPHYAEGHPPYPGFECLKIWLNLYCPSAAYEVIYNDGSPQLQVTFSDPEEAMLFRLNV
jgi:hypothetical protein